MSSKNYLITGAARGIGRGLSRLLLSKGHRVFLIDNNSSELTHTLSQLSTQSHMQDKSFSSALCDLRHPAAITQAVASASKFFDGHLDVLINNAAHTSMVGNRKSHLSELSFEDWNDSLAINLTAPMLLSQACLPLLQQSNRAQSGVILHISSTRALQSEPNNEPYSATKAGLLGLTQSMAVSLAPQGIRVNAILPGWIYVEHECQEADEKGTKWEEGLSKEDHAWHLTGRVGRVEDVLRAVEYLVENEGVCGSELVVDGGVTRKMVYPEE
ncbi:Putative short-chain dehydrogenase/reductase SDR, NAD(P)-binding domain superfamily [Septoria linicola]|uniref:Short-chain dehydrogenase/reductase SDR, NAD(P)-binding domain superfamily n=1 Tax=Septoria linicola TaxID=215465 RepID=A0A9Q9B242_9PEZI|nr:putative short-chain dehydrogenase/reductase SDR, NAD(P)-binding domain superfamily [Septoria linicola]USW54956.1 Putative short-chain dehydrogenase/reductase SDR, NAD(P)-binding domain superfamily [Septoria linicola]